MNCHVPCAVTCLLLLSATSALELYDELRSDDPEVSLMGSNYLDTGPSYGDMSLTSDSELEKHLLIYKILSSLRLKDEGILPDDQRLNWLSPEPSLDTAAPDKLPEDQKEMASKRVSKVLSDSKLNLFKPSKYPLKAQQKWKTKKGKALRSPLVCYFKLCAFRSPV